jgi:hypothetical protein
MAHKPWQPRVLPTTTQNFLEVRACRRGVALCHYSKATIYLVRSRQFPYEWHATVKEGIYRFLLNELQFAYEYIFPVA